MASQAQTTLQKIHILATGTAASSADLTWLGSLLEKDGGYQNVAALVDSHMGERATHSSITALVRQLASDGLGLTLDNDQTLQVIDSLQSQGIDSWSKLLAYCLALGGAEGQTLSHRAEASNRFLDRLDAADKSAYYGTGVAGNAVKTLLANVDSTRASLDGISQSLDALTERISSAGLRMSLVDGYISGATVFVDSNRDGVWSPGEAIAMTNDTGDFILKDSSGPLVALGGVDMSTGLAVSARFTAPAGSTIITPLTTLVRVMADTRGISDVQAQAIVKSRLGIESSLDIRHFDPIASASAAEAGSTIQASALKVAAVAAQVNTVITQTTALLRGVGVKAVSLPDAATHALAAVLLNDAPTLSLESGDTLRGVITLAATVAGATSSQLSTIDAVASDAALVIGNLNQAIQCAGGGRGLHAGKGTLVTSKSTLVGIAQVQLAADPIERLMESGARNANLSPATTASSGDALNAAIADAGARVGNVDGDDTNDAKPLVSPTPSPPAVPQGRTFILTTGTDAGDAFVGSPGDDVYTAQSDGDMGAFGGEDSLDGGDGNDVLNVTDANEIYLYHHHHSNNATSVLNIETINVTGSVNVVLDTTDYIGLTQLNVLSSNGSVDLMVAESTAVSAEAAAGVYIYGGSSQTISTAGGVYAHGGSGAISVTQTGAGQQNAGILLDGGSTVAVSSMNQGSGEITIGSYTQPTGAVTVTTGISADASGGPITIRGGTSVTVTQNATHEAGTSVTQSDVTIHGGETTTSVSITQAPVAQASIAREAVAGVPAVSAVLAAPGTQPVAAVTAVTAVSARTDVAGVIANGSVSITDSQWNTLAANTITTVALDNYGAESVIRSNALSSLSLSGTAGTLELNNATNGEGAVPTKNTTLALTVNGLRGDNTITDVNDAIRTLNVTATGADSTLAAFTDTHLSTLTITGDRVFRLNTINHSLTAIVLSGAAGFHDGGTAATNGFAALGEAATFTNTSSGAVNLSLDSSTQSYAGSTGVSTIRISSMTDAAQAITGGSSSSDELILEGGAYGLTAATALKVTGFETLGVAANVTGTIDMSQLAAGFTRLHLLGNSTIAFNHVGPDAVLALDEGSTQATLVYAGNAGPAETATIILGTEISDSVHFGTLILKDTASVGIGTVHIVSNGVDITPGDAIANFNTMLLSDNGLSTLSVSGTQGLLITTINQAANQSGSMTIHNTNTGSAGLTIGALTNSQLSSLGFTGTGVTRINTLTDASATTLSIENSGDHTAIIGSFTSTANLRNLTLAGNIQIGDGLMDGTGLTATSTAGITVNAATDHAHIKLTMSGAAAGFTDNITLGNGNNTVINASTAGTVNLTLGTGSNHVTLGGSTTNTTGTYNVTLGAHTFESGPNYITVGSAGLAYASAPNYVITGAATGDRIIFAADGESSAAELTATIAGINLEMTIALLQETVSTPHGGVAYAVFDGNTYLTESASGEPGPSHTTLVQLMGVHTFTASTGYVTVAS